MNTLATQSKEKKKKKKRFSVQTYFEAFFMIYYLKISIILRTCACAKDLGALACNPQTTKVSTVSLNFRQPPAHYVALLATLITRDDPSNTKVIS